MNYLLLCVLMSGFMASVWGGIAWLVVPHNALWVALVVFLVMFGVTVRSEEDDG